MSSHRISSVNTYPPQEHPWVAHPTTFLGTSTRTSSPTRSRAHPNLRAADVLITGWIVLLRSGEARSSPSLRATTDAHPATAQRPTLSRCSSSALLKPIGSHSRLSKSRQTRSCSLESLSWQTLERFTALVESGTSTDCTTPDIPNA